MKKCFFHIWIVTFCILMASCCHNKQQYLTVSKETLAFNYNGGIDFVQIKANCDWIVASNANWLTVIPTAGNGDTLITVTAEPNNTEVERIGRLTVSSLDGKISRGIEVSQTRANIKSITNKVWFTRTYERWDTDFFDEYIPDSYRSWIYYTDAGSENWLWYFFDDTISYQIHTHNFDTVFYPFEYTFYPDGDSIYINFLTTDLSVEDYHATIHQLDQKFFIFSDAYRPHQFEKITTANVTGGRKGPININPKKVKSKPSGPLITSHK